MLVKHYNDTASQLKLINKDLPVYNLSASKNQHIKPTFSPLHEFNESKRPAMILTASDNRELIENHKEAKTNILKLFKTSSSDSQTTGHRRISSSGQCTKVFDVSMKPIKSQKYLKEFQKFKFIPKDSSDNPLTLAKEVFTSGRVSSRSTKDSEF